VFITRVELLNIKSYRHAAVELRPGTTAIRGHNGAGKSTLVEAIGWALFDALPYSQAQFVREGEKWGQVTVTFRSAEDDREYQVVRKAGSGATWYVYDPELDHRPAEQKTDVTDFLRRHLRIESEITLEDLFNDALGVPQGMLTADFLLTPANRKKKFDALLQVEEYARAADKLKDARNYLQTSLHDQETRIALLERETGALDEWRATLVAQRERERALGAHLAQTQRQHDQTTARRDALQRREQEVRGLEHAADLARAAREAAEQAAATAGEQAAQAEEAARICAASRVDHETFERIDGDLAKARERGKVRDYYVGQRADYRSALATATRDEAHTREQLERASAAEQTLLVLMPLVTRQQELEHQRERLQRDNERLDEARRQEATRAREAELLGREIKDAEARILAIEKGRAEAEHLPARRQRVDELSAGKIARHEREARLAAIVTELKDLAEQRARAARQAHKSAANVARLRAMEPLAGQLPALESHHLELVARAEGLRATLRQHHEARTQSAGGHCPFLHEPCLNIQRRGQISLESYFDGLIARTDARLTEASAAAEGLAPELARAREAAQWCDKIQDYEERQEQDTRAVAEHDQRSATLEAERAAIMASLAGLGGASELATAQKLLQRSDEADRRLRELPPLEEHLAATRQRAAANADEQRQTAALITELAGAPDALKQAQADLTTLGDPQADYTRAEAVARERPEFTKALAAREAKRADAARLVAEADKNLEPFAGLDAEIATLESGQRTAAPGHQRYLRNVEAARRLGERRTALATAEKQVTALAAAHQKARMSWERASQGFDPAELGTVTAEATRLNAELSRATQELRSLQSDIQQREEAIAAAEALLVELGAARDEREALGTLKEMLEQFREIIKEAGPWVMKAQLRQISVEANRIFGEIMGDRAAQLAWEGDYEVVLRRQGQERHFAQLSGGEQMTAALAVRLALLRSLSRLDIAFFDEPTQNMDGERRGNLAEQLRRVHGFDQLVVISHDDTFEQGLDSVIHLEKRGNETVLLEEDTLAEIGAR
jgi:DNA repair protein SbcC/Rad50